MKKIDNKSKLIFITSVLGALLLTFLAFSIGKRSSEAKFSYLPVKEIREFEPRNEIWGKNYPKQYESYVKTLDMDFRSKFGGSAEVDMLEEDPNLVILWSGYAFSKDYKQGKGHAHAINDVRNSLRTGAPKDEKDGPMPSICWTCKSPDVPRMMHEIGIKEFYNTKLAGMGHEIVNPIGCADCHDPKTMDLVITRPALINAYKSMGKDISKSTHNEMRSLVCAQCHVEYYFKKDKETGSLDLVFPWKNGTKLEDMEKYYQDENFTDWTHSLSRAPMLKAQHPDFEIYKEGIHSKRGVSCADCHMPYVSEGGQKYSNHQLRSPLANIENTCMVCHREEKNTLLQNVYEKQDRVIESRLRLEDVLVKAHIEAKKAWELGANETQMKDILNDIRISQWRWDMVAAGHGSSFHASEEVLRILNKGLETGQEARIKITKLFADLGFKGKVEYPDISTKDKAQKFIGLDMQKEIKNKEEFKNGFMKTWDEKAKERQSKW